MRTMNCNRDNMSNSSTQRLQDALREFPQGPIKSDAFRIISLLADCWDQLKGGDETSMRDFKLDRAEQLSWDPPLLFVHDRATRGNSSWLDPSRIAALDRRLAVANHQSYGRKIPPANSSRAEARREAHCPTCLRRRAARARIGLRTCKQGNGSLAKPVSSDNQARHADSQ